jgi:hypothetical protein
MWVLTPPPAAAALPAVAAQSLEVAEEVDLLLLLRQHQSCRVLVAAALQLHHWLLPAKLLQIPCLQLQLRLLG